MMRAMIALLIFTIAMSSFAKEHKQKKKQTRPGYSKRVTRVIPSTEIVSIKMTEDGKYNIYQRKNPDDVDEGYYFDKVVPRSRELLAAMQYIKKEDVGKDYKCQEICRDINNSVVGLNPFTKTKLR